MSTSLPPDNQAGDAGAPHEVPARFLRRVWERMVAMYGYLWVNIHGVTPHDQGSQRLTMSGDTWARALSGLDQSQIATGLASCIARRSDFPPTAPQFRAMCWGIPSFVSVRDELHAKNRGRLCGPPSPFARAVWAQLDTFRYSHANAEQAEKLLRETYDLVYEQTMRGVPLPIPPAAAIDKQARKVTTATPDQCAKHFEKIRDLLYRRID